MWHSGDNDASNADHMQISSQKQGSMPDTDDGLKSYYGFSQAARSPRTKSSQCHLGTLEHERQILRTHVGSINAGRA
jgi:hypothetical protein